MNQFLGRKFIYRSLLLLGLMFSLAACSEVLKVDLSQEQADEIMVVLEGHAIKSNRKEFIDNRKRKKYSVSVNKSQLSAARRILVSYRLPKPEVPTLDVICNPEDPGLIKTPQEVKCKMQVGKQNDLMEALNLMNRVVESRVVLNLPDKNILSEEDPRPTALVVVVYIPDEQGRAPMDEKDVKRKVARGVDGLDYNDVEVYLTPANTYSESFLPTRGQVAASDPTQSKPTDPKEKPSKEDDSNDLAQAETNLAPSILGVEVSQTSSKKFKLLILVGAVLVLLMSAGAITAIFYSKNIKAENDQLKKRQRQMRLQAHKALKPAPSAVAPRNPNASVSEEGAGPYAANQTGVH